MTFTIHPGLNSTLASSTTSNGTFTAVDGLTSIDGPKSEMGTVDTTNLTSTVKTTRPTLVDPGTVTATGQYDPEDTVHQSLKTAFDAGTILFWKETFNTVTPKVASYQGYLTSFEVSGIEPEENLTFSFTIQLTTAVVIA